MIADGWLLAGLSTVEDGTEVCTEAWFSGGGRVHVFTGKQRKAGGN